MKITFLILSCLILVGCGKLDSELCLEAVDNVEIHCEVNGGNGAPLVYGFDATVQRSICDIKHGDKH